MTSQGASEGPNRKTKSITNFFTTTKSLVPLAGSASFKPSAPIPASSSIIQPSSGPISKRKASTSAPSSPTTLRPPPKRLALTRTLPIRGVHSLLTRWPTDSPLYSLGIGAKSNSSLGSASDRSASVSSQSADSLASGRSMSRARRDARDAKRVLRTIKQVKEGEYKVKKGIPGGKYLIHRQLHPSGYKYLREVELKKPENSELSDYFYGDEIRYDYTRRPYKGDRQLVIHMPSGFHEIMAGKFSDMIVRWLGNIANGSLCRVDHTKELTMEIAGEISSSLAKRVKPSEPRDDRLEPDLSFRHENCRVADMVVEVAWSQSKLQLPDRARRYIEGTKGAIRTVIGLSMNDIYRGGRRATFSFWRGEQDGDQWKRTTVADNMEFIDGNGQAVDECVLSLSLRDFICSEEATEFGDFEDVPLNITSKTLYEFYVQAFKAQIADEATEKIEEVQQKANSASEKILAIDNFIRERGTRGVSNRILMERKQLADVRANMAGLKDESTKIASLIEDIEATMDKVGDRVGVMRKVEKDRVAAARKVAEVETELARLTAEEGNWVERSIRSRSQRLLGPRRQGGLISGHPGVRRGATRVSWGNTTTIDLHVGTAASRHQSFLWLHLIQA
ncbi:hypothetical protein EKO27_g10647 [Xylaria grammica]|uniref:Uncharacterized protein n=1 Tax=Xylaria grammica TaxID=363999 RepID=A0A439CQL4_9PEZI|nr:hypothetical protein EKO27_g10647 [Xylaria grammica]